jgi:hypothetical protein
MSRSLAIVNAWRSERRMGNRSFAGSNGQRSNGAGASGRSVR